MIAATRFWRFCHGVVETLVGRTLGAVFAVDEDLRIVAWNRNAEQGLGIPVSEALGRPCYEIMPAVDVGSGRPCEEGCPLIQRTTGSAWAHNRVLQAPWAGGKQTHLDCFFLKCILPTFERGNICFVGPTAAAAADSRSLVLETVEAIYPVISESVGSQEALAVFVSTLLRTTSADAGELFLLDPESHDLVLMEHQGLPTEAVREFRQSSIGDEFPDLIRRSRVPLLAAGTWPGGSPSGIPGWYLSAPLVAESRILGALCIASKQSEYDIASAVRILFPVAVQVSAYLRWAYLVGEKRQGPDRETLPRETSRLQINCLGPFEVFVDGEPIPMARFQRFKRALTLLKLLVAHRGRPLPRQALMEFLWPGSDPRRSSGNLRVVLHALRRSLEPELEAGRVSSFILSQGDLVHLDPSDRVWVDAEQFAKGVSQAAETAVDGDGERALTEYRRVASLYRGEYMGEERYSDWCSLERTHLKEVYLNMRRQMASILAESGDVAGAIDSCRAALGVDQGREEIHRQLVGLLWEAGRRDEALRQYEACRKILRDEIGVEPSQETEALRRTMIAQVPRR